MEHWVGWFHEQTQGSEIRYIAQSAEALGFTGVAMSDHIAIPKKQIARHPVTHIAYDPMVPNIDPFTVAAAMGAVTTKLQFMTYALVSGMRDPFSIARQTASLAGLTDNRFALGITPGWLTDEIALLGHNPKTRGKRFDETLQVLKGLWQNDLYSFDGEYYSFNDVAVCPRPSVLPKVFIGGNSPKSYRRAKHHDGWIGMTVKLDEVVAIAEEVKGNDDSKKIYIIASEALSNDYILRAKTAGVDGMVHMLWYPGDPATSSAEAKHAVMNRFAEKWINNHC